MAVRGVTYSKQAVSSNDDSHIYKVLLNGRTGKTKGCGMTYSTDRINISSGYFFASNRLVEIPSTETIATPIVTEPTFCLLVFEIDLSKTNTNTAFNQGAFKVLTRAANYPEPTQEDLENGGMIYQLPFARFIKTVSGIDTFESVLEMVGMLQSNEIHVATNGSDLTGDGTSDKPFKTIQYAIDSIPKDLNDRTVSIVVPSGNYPEDITISNFYGGTLSLSFGTVTINSISVFDSCVIIQGTNLYLAATGKSYGVYCHRGANVICQVPISITGANQGIYAVFGSKFSGNRAVTVNSSAEAVVSMYASTVYISALSGIQNKNGIVAASGIVHINSIAAGFATTMYTTSGGGRIYTGAQASVPTY